MAFVRFCTVAFCVAFLVALVQFAKERMPLLFPHWLAIVGSLLVLAELVVRVCCTDPETEDAS